MKRDIKILNTIIKYCDDILDDVDFFGEDEGDYLENPRFQRSTSFSIFQIGELAKRLSLELKSMYPDVDWKGICGMRDVIGHGYEYIRLESMWETIRTDIPELKLKCTKILSALLQNSNE